MKKSKLCIIIFLFLFSMISFDLFAYWPEFQGQDVIDIMREDSFGARDDHYIYYTNYQKSFEEVLNKKEQNLALVPMHKDETSNEQFYLMIRNQVFDQNYVIPIRRVEIDQDSLNSLLLENETPWSNFLLKEAKKLFLEEKAIGFGQNLYYVREDLKTTPFEKELNSYENNNVKKIKKVLNSCSKNISEFMCTLKPLEEAYKEKEKNRKAYEFSTMDSKKIKVNLYRYSLIESNYIQDNEEDKVVYMTLPVLPNNKWIPAYTRTSSAASSLTIEEENQNGRLKDFLSAEEEKSRLHLKRDLENDFSPLPEVKELSLTELPSTKLQENKLAIDKFALQKCYANSKKKEERKKRKEQIILQKEKEDKIIKKLRENLKKKINRLKKFKKELTILKRKNLSLILNLKSKSF